MDCGDFWLIMQVWITIGFRKENMQYCHICNDHDPFTFHECHPNFHLIIIRGIFLSDKIVFSISNFLEYFTQQSQDNVSPFFYFQPKKQMLWITWPKIQFWIFNNNTPSSVFQNCLNLRYVCLDESLEIVPQIHKY